MAHDETRFAVVRLGAFGEICFACSRERAATGIAVTSLCSRSTARTGAPGRRYGGPRWYTDVARLAADPEVDVACVPSADEGRDRVLGGAEWTD